MAARRGAWRIVQLLALALIVQIVGCKASDPPAEAGIKEPGSQLTATGAVPSDGKSQLASLPAWVNPGPIQSCYLEKLTPLRLGMTEEELRAIAPSVSPRGRPRPTGTPGLYYSVTLPDGKRVHVVVADDRIVRIRLTANTDVSRSPVQPLYGGVSVGPTANPDVSQCPVYPGQPFLLCNTSSWDTPPIRHRGYAWIGVVCEGVEAAFRPGKVGILPLRAEDRVAWVDLVPTGPIGPSHTATSDVAFGDILAVVRPGMRAADVVASDHPVVYAADGMLVSPSQFYEAYRTYIKGIDVTFTVNECDEVVTVSVRDPRVVLGRAVRVGTTYAALKEMYPDAHVKVGRGYGTMVWIDNGWAGFLPLEGRELGDEDRVMWIEVNDYFLKPPGE